MTVASNFEVFTSQSCCKEPEISLFRYCRERGNRELGSVLETGESFNFLSSKETEPWMPLLK
jgi:hypothetical protein